MKNVSIIYWSGTGNTQKMAEAVAEGAKTDGVTISVIDVLEATRRTY